MDEDKSLPWSAGDSVVTEDNVIASQLRYDAIAAVKLRKATPEQYALVAETDRVMKEAVQMYKEKKHG